MRNEKRLFSVPELSEYLSLKERTIYNWASQRKIPFVKIGGALRFDKQDIDKMIEGVMDL